MSNRLYLETSKEIKMFHGESQQSVLEQMCVYVSNTFGNGMSDAIASMRNTAYITSSSFLEALRSIDPLSNIVFFSFSDVRLGRSMSVVKCDWITINVQ